MEVKDAEIDRPMPGSRSISDQISEANQAC